MTYFYLPDGAACPSCLLPRRVHLLGIAGQGMTALAGLLIRHGHAVTACDSQSLNPAVDLLHNLAVRLNVPISHPNDEAHVVREVDALVVSSFTPSTHPEVARALSLEIPVFKREEVLGDLLQREADIRVGIAGVAGKSTTTALLAHIISTSGHSPTVAVGAFDPNNDGLNYRTGGERLAVYEACEFQRAFLQMPPTHAIVTNLYWGEHLETYSSRSEMQDAFLEFLAPSRFVAIGIDDPGSQQLARRTRGVVSTFGTSRDADLRVDYAIADGIEKVGFYWRDSLAGEMTSAHSQLAGAHNYVNAAGALLMAQEITHRPIESLLESVHTFRPLGRRLEEVGCVGTMKVVDDYAHHPSQLSVASRTIRGRYPHHSIICYFEPTNYKRLATLWADYVSALLAFDLVLVEEVGVGTFDEPQLAVEVNSRRLVAELCAAGGRAAVTTLSAVSTKVMAWSTEPSVLVVCGARRSGSAAKTLLLEMTNAAGPVDVRSDGR
jgi:UDP-N-acetylmuramate--alanine ligase